MPTSEKERSRTWKRVPGITYELPAYTAIRVPIIPGGVSETPWAWCGLSAHDLGDNHVTMPASSLLGRGKRPESEKRVKTGQNATVGNGKQTTSRVWKRIDGAMREHGALRFAFFATVLRRSAVAMLCCAAAALGFIPMLFLVEGGTTGSRFCACT
ncbi:hypothetical protein FB451DRAFT_497029 [Mycena latifolia]|nr:hypothetical protein FB451DRAFT_497029 [Mycena latifolia]